MLSISNPGRLVRLTILLPAVLNALTFDRIIPANVSYIAGSLASNPSGLLPTASNFFLDFAVTSLNFCSSFLDACGASISDLALRFALGFGLASTLGGFSMFSYSSSSFAINLSCVSKST